MPAISGNISPRDPWRKPEEAGGFARLSRFVLRGGCRPLLSQIEADFDGLVGG